ncbi:MAG: ABC transporter permease [Desulfovibrio sp.]|jgi:putative ABC transport system permease protein|nr:ABC transporter permease [Desulfovibrio sp.]
MRRFVIIAGLAIKDWWHERTLTLCAVLALAGMLTPLLALYGVRVGLVENLRASLLRDPAALIIIPVGSSGGFDDALFEQLRARPDVRFVTARTRDVAAEMPFAAKNGVYVPLTLEPTAPGDPLLERFGLALHPPDVVSPSSPSQGDASQNDPARATPAAENTVLSAGAAAKLSAAAGDILNGRLGRRRPDGILETVSFTARVAGVLPPEAIASDTAFFPLSVLEHIQDYRDYVAVPVRGWAGDPPPAVPRRYESFRLYARDLDSVENLDDCLRGLHINVLTRAKNIADIRKIDNSLNQLLLVIALAVGAGFVAFTLSSSLAAVRRKERTLGMLRLLGFARTALLCYPLWQALATCICGTLAAWLLALGVAVSIDAVFAEQLAGSAVCVIRITHFGAALGVTIALSLAAAFYPAISAAGIEPALVVRDV